MVPIDEITALLLPDGQRLWSQAPFAAVLVSGPDAADFLQRLCSQDVVGLGDGALVPAAFLDAKGRLLFTVHVGRFAAGFVLQTQADRAAALATMLERYHFNERLTVAPAATLGCSVTIQRLDPATDAAGDHTRNRLAGDPASANFEVELVKRGLLFTFRHGQSSTDAVPLDPSRAECLRMFAGLVFVGRDTDERTLALEVPLDDAISTTKGCYTGQEIVARIHTYGHTNRRLCLVIVESADVPQTPAIVSDTTGAPVGRLMSCAPLPATAGAAATLLGQALLPRSLVVAAPALQLEAGAVLRLCS